MDHGKQEINEFDLHSWKLSENFYFLHKISESTTQSCSHLLFFQTNFCNQVARKSRLVFDIEFQREEQEL